MSCDVLQRARDLGFLDGEIVASVSGGKDSTALSLWLSENGIEHRRVFADTGWEAEQTYEYIHGPLKDAIGPIDIVAGDLQMEDLIRKKAMFPSRVRRFCTEELKVKPIFDYLFDLVETGRDLVNAVGIRAAESASRSRMLEVDGYSDKRGSFAVWRPLLAWSEQDVIDIHQRHGLPPNPLYFAGASRVGCWPCIYARKGEIKLWADMSPERVDALRELEEQLTEAADARAAAKGEENEHPRTFFAGRGPESQGGREGAMRIDRVVEWAQTGRGGRQLLLDLPDDSSGCVRWGMCEHLTEDSP